VHSLQFGRWCPVLFRYYLLGGDTVAPSGLLARLCHAFLVFFLLGAKLSQYLLDRFSRCFHQMEGICVSFLHHVQFFRFLKGHCHGNQFCFVPDLFARSHCGLGPLKRFSQSLHHIVGIELQMINPTFFSRYLKGRCHGNQFSGKNEAKLPTPLHLSLCHSDTE